MKKIITLAAFLFPTIAFAQIDLMQSPSSIEWKYIENDHVRVIYPDYFGAQSIYVANLVEHYSKVVGQTYGIASPEKFNLVIRTEVAQPNGYVTLAPRRSEWFTSTTFAPAVGSTEWFQTLSIHEYRHVNQFDHFADGFGTKVYYYLMGDFGIQLASALAMPSWYLEGDAVWAETKYTDAGRGRAPRFMARLKALVQSGQIPTYDQFLNRTYKTNLPNQYVYGYALVSYATQKYGEDIWHKVLQHTAGFPHPFRFYYSFRQVTGQYFEDFYFEAMNDLRTKWGEGPPAQTKFEDYRESYHPVMKGGSLFYVHQNLDELTSIQKSEHGQSRKITELFFSNEFMQIDFGHNVAVFTEFRPDSRYGHKGSSDLILTDLNQGSKTKLTSQRMIYSPALNQAENKILSIEFKKDQKWYITEFDFTGKELRSFAPEKGNFVEAKYLDDDNAIAILLDTTGHRSLVKVSLSGKNITQTLLPGSRNMITALYVDKNKRVFFEAQAKGRNEIFSLTPDNSFSQCTKSAIASYTPSSDGETVYFSTEDNAGTHIQNMAVKDCQTINASQLLNFQYLGTDPSDNYNGFAPVTFSNQESMFTENKDRYQAKDYGDFDRQLFIPHTWGLALGRGGGLGLKTDNYLRTLGAEVLIGTDPEEERGFGKFSFDIKKFYPVIQLQAEQRDRAVTSYTTEDTLKWTEVSTGLGVLVPYIKKIGVYNLSLALTGGGQYTDAKDYQFNDSNVAGSNYFYLTNAAFTMAWFKDAAYRSLMAPWLVSYQIRHDNAEQPSQSAVGSYRVYQEGMIQIPGLFKHDGFRFIYDEQRQEDAAGSYRFLPAATNFNGYIFSRGYDYKDVSFYQKVSGNYAFPIAYPDLNIPNWIFLRRVYGNLFFDSTYLDSVKVDSTLNSYGAEALFESVILRVLPITFGGRITQRLLDDEVRGEFFLQSAVF